MHKARKQERKKTPFPAFYCYSPIKTLTVDVIAPSLAASSIDELQRCRRWKVEERLKLANFVSSDIMAKETSQIKSRPRF